MPPECCTAEFEIQPASCYYSCRLPSALNNDCHNNKIMSKVFISYSSNDSDFAELVEMKLKKSNIPVWIDSGIRSGDEWQHEIDNALDECCVQLVILSPSSLNARYVTYEFGYAMGQKKKVIPLLYNDADKHPRIASLQHRDFTRSEQHRWKQLANDIKDARENPTNAACNPSSVFISYDNEDAFFAELVQERLENQAIAAPIWIKYSGGLRAGDTWQKEIDTALDNSKVVLVILSPNSLNSQYVTYEFGYALGQKKRVIPILHKDTERHPRLESLHSLDFRDKRSRPWDELFTQINEELSRDQGLSVGNDAFQGKPLEEQFLKLCPFGRSYNNSMEASTAGSSTVEVDSSSNEFARKLHMSISSAFSRQSSSFTPPSLNSPEEEQLEVNNLDHQTTEDQLLREFSQHVQVDEITIPYDRDKDRNKGVAYVKLKDPEKADYAIKRMDKAIINDRPIKVSLKRPTHARYNPDGVKVYIGRLNFSTSKECIREAVEKIARVKRIELPVDKESGRRKGCAFVTVANMDDANQVIDQLNGFSLDGRSIIVELAKKKK